MLVGEAWVKTSGIGISVGGRKNRRKGIIANEGLVGELVKLWLLPDDNWYNKFLGGGVPPR